MLAAAALPPLLAASVSGNCDGPFFPPNPLIFAAGDGPTSVTTGDGLTDLTTAYRNFGDVSVLLNQCSNIVLLGDVNLDGTVNL